MDGIQLNARINLRTLRCNGYPGRGFVIGINEAGHFIQVYWIMGRSENSRNRIFVANGGSLSTAPADVTKVEDTSLTIYNAMCEIVHCNYLESRHYIVSNGSQTDIVARGIRRGISAYEALQDCKYEPDEPNFTPRITGVITLCKRKVHEPLLLISILRKAPWNNATEREFFTYEYIPRGIGFCVTTYDGNAAKGKPLPSFSEKPYPVSLEGTPEKIARSFWDPEAGYFGNLIALAVKQIDLDTCRSKLFILNKHSQVPAGVGS